MKQQEHLTPAELRSCFRAALKRSFPVVLGYLPVGAAFGMMMADAGYAPYFAAVSSLFVFAGSLQMLMVSFLTAGIPLLTAAVTALLLNSRHIFYGLSFLKKFRSCGFGERFLLIFTLTDENYALLCAEPDTDGADAKRAGTERMLTVTLTWFSWTLFSFLGAIAGSRLPFDLTGIDFALPALFLVIVTDQLRGSRTASGRQNRLPALTAAAASFLSLAVFGTERFLLPALCITSAALLLLRPVCVGSLRKEDRKQ